MAKLTKRERLEQLKFAQVCIYTMVGGGFLGRSFAEQPANAYIDSRVRKRPYSATKIEKARKHLVLLATQCGLDAGNLPSMQFNCNMGGVF